MKLIGTHVLKVLYRIILRVLNREKRIEKCQKISQIDLNEKGQHPRVTRERKKMLLYCIRKRLFFNKM